MNKLPNEIEVSRVMVEMDGLSVPPKQAKDVFQITPDIIFLRDDGWSLGAPLVLEKTAYDLWKDNWTHFVRKGHNQWIEIARYLG